MKVVASFVFLLVTLWASSVAYADESAAENVVTLTTDSFDDSIAANEFVLVEFYAPWCGHCQRLAPEYEKAATTLKDSNIVLAKVDATVEKELATRFQIRGFPTLKFFVDGEAQEYTGGRSEESIVSWLRKKTGPPSRLLTSEDEYEEFVAGKKVAVIAFFDSEDSDSYSDYADYAKKSEDFEFAHILDVELAKAHGFEAPNSVKLVRNFDEDIVEKIDADFDFDSFLNAEAHPPFEEISQAAFGRFMKAGKAFGIVWLDEAKETAKEVKEWAEELAKKYKGKFPLSFGDANKFRGAVSALGGSGNVIPTLTVTVPPKDEQGRPDNSGFNEEIEFTKESVMELIEQVLDGSYVPWRKSQAIPEKNDDPVYVLVYKSFDDIVYSDKDVLVEFYAPCKNVCKSLP